MSLVALVEFVLAADPKTSLALCAPAIAPGTPSAHVHIGRSGRVRAAAENVLLDKGTQRCPCAVHVSFAELAEWLEDDQFGAELFMEPLGPAPLRLDVSFERRRDETPDERWSSELLLPSCGPGSLRVARIPELLDRRCRLSIRCTCPSSPNAMFQLRANEPLERRPARAPIVMEAPRGR